MHLNIKIYKTIILPVALYGCGTCSLTLREVHRQRVFEKRLLRIFGPKSNNILGERKESCKGGCFIIFTHHQLSLVRWDQEGGGLNMWHAMEWRGKCTGFWWESVNGKDHS
jgi:hypothetical protein